jgi:hypothetical protein
MRKKPIPCSRALEGYIAYKFRLTEIIRLTTVYLALKGSPDKLELDLDEVSFSVPKSQAAETVLLATIGWGVGLVDNANGALNIFEVWKSLYPQHLKEIQELSDSLKNDLKVACGLRNKAAFHADTDLQEQFDARGEASHHAASIITAFQRIVGLSIKLGGLENAVYPGTTHLLGQEGKAIDEKINAILGSILSVSKNKRTAMLVNISGN